MKKLVSGMLAAVIAATTLASASALDYGSEWSGYESAKTTDFKDVPDTHWAVKNIDRAVSKGWFSGYPDGTFHPDASITRAEAMTVFVNFLGLQVKPVTENPYYDVKASDWYAPQVAAGKKLFPQIVTYNGQTPFQPEMPITREDTVHALVIALKYNDKLVNADQSVLNMFKDKNSISENIKPYMTVAVKYGLVSGYDDGTIGAQDPLTRAEFATLLSRGSTVGFGTGGGLADVSDETPAPTPTPTPTPDQPQQPINETTVTGRVINAENAAMQGVSVKGSDGSSAVTDINGQYTFTTSASSITITATKDGYVPAQTTMTLNANTTNYAETLKLVTAAQGTIAGYVYDAVVRDGIVKGAEINFRANGNSTTGDIITSATSDEQGKYSVSLPTGTYTAECKKAGYSTAYVTVVSQESEAQQDITLVPEMEGTAFILTWGETPLDIDSHLTGPKANGSRFHVFYYDKKAYDGETEVANLDRDDIDSYGPETVTLLKQKNGTYRYSVHDYSNRYSNNSKALSLSGAKVTVYVNGEYKNTFNVPVNTEGTIWTVFELNGDTITPINTMAYQLSPGGISGEAVSRDDDVARISSEMTDKE